MSNLEANSGKRLSVKERNKLSTAESLQKGSSKKTSISQSATSLKTTPSQPLSRNVVKSTSPQPTTLSSRVSSSKPAQTTSGKSSDSNAVVTETYSILSKPQNVKDPATTSSKPKEGIRRPTSSSYVRRSSGTSKDNVGLKSSHLSRTPVMHNGTNPTAKTNPVSKSHTKVSSSISSEVTSRNTSNVTANRNQSKVESRLRSAVTNNIKSKNSSHSQVRPFSTDSKAAKQDSASKPLLKPGGSASRIKKDSPTSLKNSSQNLSQRRVSGSTNKSPWQQRTEPLSKDKRKTSTKGSPPTAVVSPIQDRSKTPSSTDNKISRQQRPASSHSKSHHKKQASAVSYSAAADNVILPELSIAEKNSVMADESKVKRSSSQVSEVTAQLKEAEIKNEKVGHNFVAHELKAWMNWCDACGGVILSLFGKCVSCTKCKMVCHGKCALAVSLTCEADQQLSSLTLTNDALRYYKTIVQETKDESTLKEFNTIQRVISLEEVQERLEEFNKTAKGTQQMTLQEDGKTFRGFIRVSMNLTRPVSVVDSYTSKTVRKPPTSQYRKASFYIDKGAMKALHITSDTTAEEVVQSLLHKYNITDNPMKFALFEKQDREEGHVILRKMLPRERPLFLRLLWRNGEHENRNFTLQENESRDIHWESFSIPELHMFIKILDKEENDYILEIKKKYENRAKDIKNAIEHQSKMIST